ncbi:MATE family efflux transporter [Clostridium diolis]|uniref:MATE family efflux transporter n=1 Tax=Clostridium diolis TaxID=223919 RepID=UPI003AF8AC55
MKGKNELFLKEMSIEKLLISMSLQTTLSIIMYSLYNIINMIYVSRFIGTYAVGGLVVSSPIFIVLGAVSTTLGSGAASVISRSLGETDYEKANKSAANTFLIFGITALIISIIGLSLLDPLVYLLGATDKLASYSKDYLRVILFGAITSTAFSSIIRAEGNAKFSTYLWVIPVIINMILDPIFIIVLKMGVTGVAIATVISQICSVLMSMYYFFVSGKSMLKISVRHFKPSIMIIREIIAIGIPSFIQQASSSILIIIMNNILKVYGGDLTISAYGITSRLSTFLIIPQTGLVQGVQPIIGYNFGAGEFHRVRKAVKLSSIAVASYGVIVFIISQLIPKTLLSIFSSDKSVVELGAIILRYITITFPFTGMQNVAAAFFQSTGKFITSLVLSLCSNNLCYIPILLIMSKLFGIKGIWLSFPIASVLSFIILLIFINKKLNKRNILN